MSKAAAIENFKSQKVRIQRKLDDSFNSEYESRCRERLQMLDDKIAALTRKTSKKKIPKKLDIEFEEGDA